MSTGEGLGQRWIEERAIEAEQEALALRQTGVFPDLAWACRSMWREENSNNAGLMWAHRQVPSISLDQELERRLKRARLLLEAGNLFTAWAPLEYDIRLLGAQPFTRL